jgi:hypothetical protein
MQTAITPPKADLLSPAVAQLVGEVLSTVSRDDVNPIGDYIEMCRTSPIVGALLDVIRLYAHSMMGEYDNENEEYKTFVVKCFEVMQGSLKMAVDQLMCVKPLGYAVSEWAPIERDGKWVLDAIRILDPRKYEFEGTRNGIEFIVYEGDTGSIKIPYDRVIHLTNQQHLSFDDPYGVADCRRVIAPYKAWKIAIAAALIAAKRRGEPVIVGFAPSDQQVKIGTDRATGEPILVSAPTALMTTLQGLENNSIAATDIANKIETIQAADGQLIMLVLKELERLQLMGFLVPETILSATGVGDSSLNAGHRSILDLMVGSTIDQIKEKLIEQVVRPLLIWEFGEAVEDFGSFPTPKASETGAIDLLNAIANAVYNGAFSAADLDVINRMRELAGLPLVTEVVDPLAGAPTDAAADPIDTAAPPVDAATDTGIDAAAANFAAARGGRGKGRKKGKGQKNCNKGVNCGGTCISAKKACRKDNPSPAVKTKAKRSKASKSGGGGGGGALDEKKLDGLIANIDKAKAAYFAKHEAADAISDRLSSEDIPDKERLKLVRDREKLWKERNKLAGTQNTAQEKAEAFMGAYREKLMASGMKRSDAEKLAGNVKLEFKDKKIADAVKEDLIEFNMLTNGAIGDRLKIVGNVEKRAYARQAGGFVNTGSDVRTVSRKSTLFHEFGHLAEDAATKKSNNEWVRRRGGDKGELEPLSKLTKNEKYGDNEKAVPDKFYSPYVGKYYGNEDALRDRSLGWAIAPTEVLSMGLEKFTKPSDMLSLYRQDKEHFGIVQQYLDRQRGAK